MPKRKANSPGVIVLTASALADASQLCPIPAVQTLFRLAALALDISAVRTHIFLLSFCSLLLMGYADHSKCKR